ncbi:6-bladed beta-propeller [uncultured Ruegeria sp.]|uniref:6-bladed beta-propeller n=1 Tax=uncultured Ruegeria sp. TaxID=259304 RepID=UPI00260749E1|nr:6-bladed beta-propeller [uncultured Ruegeria sp.]
MADTIVGLGSGLYNVDCAKLTAPEEVFFDGLSDVAILNHEIIIARRAKTNLMVFTLRGQFVRSVNIKGFHTVHGLRALGNGELAMTDMDGHNVFLLGSDGSSLRTLSKNGMPRFQKAFNHPCDCDRAGNGNYYVADGYGNSVVHIFNRALEHVRTFGKPGDGKGEFSTPHSVLIDDQQRVCVADRENNRVQRFDLEGNYLDEIGGVYKPMALEKLPNGTLLCTDQTPRLSAFTPDGELVGRCRTFGTYGHGLAVAEDGTIVVAEMLPNRISILRPTSATRSAHSSHSF